MLHIFLFLICMFEAYGYYNLPGKCPENVKLQEEFRLADFFGKWYQTYHYSSDGLQKNNCSTIELMTKPTGIYLNQSRIDRGIFHRFSMGKLVIPVEIENAANLNVTFIFNDAPRRLKVRKYPFRVLATNYNYYATVYTCQYSSLINKHFIYVWILSRNHNLNVVSKELATRPLRTIGVNSTKLIQNDNSKCNPKYFEDVETEPTTFRFPVPI